jgi:hypothetical protein
MNAVSADSAALASRGVAYASEIAGAARRHGLDPRLLAAVAAQETGGPGANAGSNITGDGGHGHGVFQIDDRWHAFAKTPGAADPAKNADYAAGMLSGLISRYGGDVHAALSAYNAGSPNATGTTTRWGDGQVLGYADSVLRHEQRIAGSSAAPAAASPFAPAPNAPAQNAPANPADVEACRADSASLSQSVNALASQAIALAQLALEMPGLASQPSLPALSLPLAAQTIMYLTDTAAPERQREKNLHYLLPNQTNEIAQPYGCVVTIERAYAP